MDSMIVNNNSYLDPNLQKATDLIRKYDLSVRTNQYAIAFVMSCVDHDKLYIKDGFNSAQEWAKDAFNLGKTQAYALIKVGANFTREIRNNKGKVIAYASTLVDSEPGTAPVIDYDMSKLIRLTKFDPAQVKAWHDAELITPRMTVKELEQFCKLQLAKPAEETEPEQPEPTEPAERKIELPINRPQAFDSFATDWLIAELNLRGFTVSEGTTVYNVTFKGDSE